ncbi:hypothetical protein [Pseudomonas sp. Q1-7]|nr:hypothetical protein [Pseudomonas sp. Q1-7]
MSLPPRETRFAEETQASPTSSTRPKRASASRGVISREQQRRDDAA